jgi:hypothetical protein
LLREGDIDVKSQIDATDVVNLDPPPVMRVAPSV